MTQAQTIERILTIWKQYPTLRLFQLFVVAGVHNRSISEDSFYLSDQALVEQLEKWHKEKTIE